jgi:aryl-alcohol dehydrogenase-like predicted oxidoreductase
MKTRALDRSGLRIAPVVFGANVFGWTVDRFRRKASPPASKRR